MSDSPQPIVVDTILTLEQEESKEEAPQLPITDSNTKLDTEFVENIFDKMDIDGDGYLSPVEIRKAFKQINPKSSLSEKELRKFINDADEDKDGQISKEELVHIAERVHAEGKSGLWGQFFHDVEESKMFMFDQKVMKQLETLPDGVLCNLAKVGGSVIMLRDNNGFIYKQMNDEAELRFYTLAHESQKNGKKPDAFLRYLTDNHLIPACNLQGYVLAMTADEILELNLKHHPSGYYKQVDKDTPNATSVIIMENLIKDMSRPASCDFKLGRKHCGSFPGEPGYASIQKCADEVASWGENEFIHKGEVLKKWKSYKSAGKAKEVTHDLIGLKTVLDLKEIKALMKSWRQEQNNQKSPVKEISFRCCGMRVGGDDDFLDFKYEPQKTDGKIDLTKPDKMSPEAMSELVEDFCQNDKDLAEYFIQRLHELKLWFSFNTHYRFYASSVCLFYDMDDHSKREVKWLDFAHAEEMQNPDGTRAWKSKKKGGQIDKSVRLALNNLIDCIAPVVWEEEN